MKAPTACEGMVLPRLAMLYSQRCLLVVVIDGTDFTAVVARSDPPLFVKFYSMPGLRLPAIQSRLLGTIAHSIPNLV
jgi:hypothetical protein